MRTPRCTSRQRKDTPKRRAHSPSAARIIARIEHGPKGRNPRFIVTNLEGEANELYERVYCARGDMENRIKAQTARTCIYGHLEEHSANA